MVAEMCREQRHILPGQRIRGVQMWTAISEIARVLASSASLATNIRVATPAEAAEVIHRVQERYLGGRDPRFWWEYLPSDHEGYNPPNGDVLWLLPQLAPSPHEPAWFIAGLTKRDQESMRAHP